MKLQETPERDLGLPVYRAEGVGHLDEVLFSLRRVRQEIEAGALPDLFWIKGGPHIPIVRRLMPERGFCHIKLVTPHDVSEAGIHRPSDVLPFYVYACPSSRPAIPFRMNFWKSSRIDEFMTSQGVDESQIELYSDESLRPDADHPEAHVAAGIALLEGVPNVAVDWQNRQGQMLAFHAGSRGWYFQRPPRITLAGSSDQLLKISPMQR